MNRICNKLIFCILSLIFIFSFDSQIFGQNKKKIKEIPNENPQNVTNQNKDARRIVVENRILNGEYLHDGSGELIYIGTRESVPALLKVLKTYANTITTHVEEQPPPAKLKKGESPAPPFKPKVTKTYICTYGHALAALYKITGQTFIDYEDWKNWWEKYQKENQAKKN